MPIAESKRELDGSILIGPLIDVSFRPLAAVSVDVDPVRVRLIGGLPGRSGTKAKIGSGGGECGVNLA
tara:strand:- start:2183 stop:2386 length:204 start_codon:yes stop_codon:yes gene_type:complete